MRAFVAALVSACSVGLAACDSAEDPPRDVPIESIEAEVIDVICNALSACDCDPMRSFYPSSAQCRETTNALADQIRLSRDELGLTWDSACLGVVLDRIDDAGCDGTLGESEEDECAPPCYYLHGDLQAGDPCSFSDQFVSDCAQGLLCQQGQCAAPCDTNNDAFAGNGEECIERPCQEGLLCNYEVGRCELLPKIG